MSYFKTIASALVFVDIKLLRTQILRNPRFYEFFDFTKTVWKVPNV